MVTGIVETWNYCDILHLVGCWGKKEVLTYRECGLITQRKTCKDKKQNRAACIQTLSDIVAMSHIKCDAVTPSFSWNHRTAGNGRHLWSHPVQTSFLEDGSARPSWLGDMIISIYGGFLTFLNIFPQFWPPSQLNSFFLCCLWAFLLLLLLSITERSWALLPLLQDSMIRHCKGHS